jgi:RNA polymerase sigma-54 factor
VKIQLTTRLSQVLNQNVYQAIEMLQYSNEELEKFVDEKVLENPLLVKKSYDSFSNKFDILPAKKSYYEELFCQSRISFKKKIELNIAYFLIENLDEFGFLSEIPENDFLAKDIEKVLSVMKNFEPIGVFSKNFSEFINTFLKDANINVNENFIDNINLLQKMNLKEFSNHINMSIPTIKKLLSIIKRMPKYPFYKEDDSCFAIPDFSLNIEDGICHISFNENFEINIDSNLFTKITSKEDLSYLKHKKRDALWLINSIAKRKGTILKVAKAIIKKQKLFFLTGKMNSLTIKDIAKELSISESTVSRSIKDKTIFTKYGTFELKYFLTRGVNSDLYNWDDEKTASRFISLNLRKAISGECKTNPLSDESLVDRLKNEGIIVARRTIAKYRSKLKIPKAFERKKQYEICSEINNDAT